MLLLLPLRHLGRLGSRRCERTRATHHHLAAAAAAAPAGALAGLAFQQQPRSLPVAASFYIAAGPRRGLSSSSHHQAQPMSVQAAIEAKLQQGLSPTYMQVLNESYMHNVPKGAETHFKVVVASAAFEGKMLLARHRVINTLLDVELKGGVHALSIIAKTPAEWEASSGAIPPSPQCRGGGKH